MYGAMCTRREGRYVYNAERDDKSPNDLTWSSLLATPWLAKQPGPGTDVFPHTPGAALPPDCPTTSPVKGVDWVGIPH